MTLMNNVQVENLFACGVPRWFSQALIHYQITVTTNSSFWMQKNNHTTRRIRTPMVTRTNKFFELCEFITVHRSIKLWRRRRNLNAKNNCRQRKNGSEIKSSQWSAPFSRFYEPGAFGSDVAFEEATLCNKIIQFNLDCCDKHNIIVTPFARCLPGRMAIFVAEITDT